MKFKILIAGVLLVICSGTSFAAVPVMSTPARVPTYKALAATESATLLTASYGKNACISGIVCSAVADSLITIYDNATTPNILTKFRVPAKDTVEITFPVAIIGSRSTSINSAAAAAKSLVVMCDVVTAVEITAFGFEK